MNLCWLGETIDYCVASYIFIYVFKCMFFIAYVCESENKWHINLHRLPLGNTGKGGLSRYDREEKAPSKESSPRADMKKPSAFVEVSTFAQLGRSFL